MSSHLSMEPCSGVLCNDYMLQLIECNAIFEESLNKVIRDVIIQLLVTVWNWYGSRLISLLATSEKCHRTFVKL